MVLQSCRCWNKSKSIQGDLGTSREGGLTTLSVTAAAALASLSEDGSLFKELYLFWSFSWLGSFVVVVVVVKSFSALPNRQSQHGKQFILLIDALLGTRESHEYLTLPTPSSSK